MVTQLIPSFNAGEWSPLVGRRSDLVKYRSGLKTLRNCQIMTPGGLRRRAGLEMVAGTKGNGRARMIRFQYSTSVSYMLELGEGYLRVWQRDKTAVTTLGVILAPLSPGDDARVFPVDFYRNQAGTLYRCVEEHEETTFAADLAAGKWVAWTGPLEFATPYTAEELRDVQYLQTNALMRFVHPNHMPHVFRFDSAAVCYFREIAWTYPALLDENTEEEVKITTDFPTGAPAAWSGSAVVYKVGDKVTYSSKTWQCNKKHTSAAGKAPGTGTYQGYVESPVLGGIFSSYVPKPIWTEIFYDNSALPGQSLGLTATAEVFTDEHVGAYFEVSLQRAATSYQVDLRALDTNDGKRSATLAIQGAWQFSTFGIWDGTFYLERSIDRGATWEDVRAWQSDKDRNVTASGNEAKRCLMRLRWQKDGSTTTGKPRGVLEAGDGYIRGVVRITEVTDGKTATAVCVIPVEKCTTQYWAEGAWSDAQGYPRALVFHEDSVIYGGTEKRSQDVWSSVKDDWDNFRRGVTASDGWTANLSADQQNAIQWMLSGKQLLIGTAGSEWVISSLKDDTALSAGNTKIRRHSGHGSEHLQATLVNEATLFVQRGRRILREQVFSFEADGYVTKDLSIFAEHMTQGGVVETAYQQKPDSILWSITEDGKLLGLTYERGEEVGGWHRHETQGTFESVAVMSTDGEEDEVWFVVCRTVGGVPKRFIERFAPGQVRAQETDHHAGFFLVDAGVSADGLGEGFAINSVDGCGHLVGKVCWVIADGNVLKRREITAETFVLGGEEGDPEDAQRIVVGLPYQPVIEPLPLAIPMDNGSSAGRMFKVTGVDMYLHKSGSFELGAVLGGPADPVNMREVGMEFDKPVPLFTGLKHADLEAENTRDASFVITQEMPLPLCLLGVVPKFTVNGDR